MGWLEWARVLFPKVCGANGEHNRIAFFLNQTFQSNELYRLEADNLAGEHLDSICLSMHV